tara:strand:+ start:778 stop:978 length:201 start_codon:yes stop_codon:yes gene_type:complete
LYPEPTLSIYLDIDPTEAWNRKFEYTITYLEEKRDRYKSIFGKVRKSLEVYNDNIDSTINEIITCL